ncbi:hypothetical protein AVEN_245672-1 [Araneus ventricosus]|uniref:Pre-C2HC domain-containing protein n=1 Tax=Araneus ventricosus TaxID=182803 RepID=A0A4Y2P7V7_ARAVE|nr:hypothetical protein AVEN_245672-1 [Araneus ventricosus]
MDQLEITQSLEEKGFKIERITQMKNYREKTLLPLYLANIKKSGNFTNIYNIKDLCYYRVKIEPYRKRTKAIIFFNCSGFYHSARNCRMKPRCIKCSGEHATRDCNIKGKLWSLPVSTAGRKAIWRPGNAVKPYLYLQKQPRENQREVLHYFRRKFKKLNKLRLPQFPRAGRAAESWASTF